MVVNTEVKTDKDKYLLRAMLYLLLYLGTEKEDEVVSKIRPYLISAVTEPNDSGRTRTLMA